MTALGLHIPAFSQEWVTETRFGPDPPTQEVWAGADVSGHSWAVYSGVTMAPFGPIMADGWRLRIVGGYGQYEYRSIWALNHKRWTFRGAVNFAEALVGYHQQWANVTVKAFVGFAAETHAVVPFDPDNEVFGYDGGLKGALETWVDVTPLYWTSLDLSWSSAFQSYAGRLRAARRFGAHWSIGVESAAMGNMEYDGARAGAFLRYAWPSGEVSLAAGSSAARSPEDGGYMTVNALYRY